MSRGLHADSDTPLMHLGQFSSRQPHRFLHCRELFSAAINRKRPPNPKVQIFCTLLLGVDMEGLIRGVVFDAFGTLVQIGEGTHP